MKRIAAIMLCLAMACCLGACSRQEANPTQSIQRPDPMPATAETEPILAEQVIFDSEGIRITVKGIEENTANGAAIPVLVENGTDRNIVFSGDLFVVNGVTIPGYLYAEAAAGTKTNDAIEFFTDVLDSASVSHIGTVRSYDARIVDTDTYETMALVPTELMIARGGTGEDLPEDSGVLLYEQAGITVMAQMISDAFYGKTARLLVKNETGRDVIVEAEHISVNGYTVDAWLYDTVVKDTVRYCQLDLFETGLAENGIDQVETISFRMNILDATSFETITQSEVLTVEVKG